MSNSYRHADATQSYTDETKRTTCRYWLCDDFLGLDELQALEACWPLPDWPGWVHYDPRIETKRASDRQTSIPVFCAQVLARMAQSSIGERLGMEDSVPDLSLHGGGLHEVLPGGQLGCHLDADGHPRLGLERAWSALLYVGPCWEPSWHGELLLCDESRQGVVTLPPVPGRLVAFDCRNTYHGVSRVSSQAAPRRALALFGYLPRPSPGLRPRAQFVAWPEQENDGHDEIRRNRSR